MGIINVTPDSFSDGGRLFTGGRWSTSGPLWRAPRRCSRMGRPILDVGGESTRPGARTRCRRAEECRPCDPRRGTAGLDLDTIVSVDTSKAEVAQRVRWRPGCHICQRRLRRCKRPGMLPQVAGERQRGVCLMHMRGEPRLDAAMRRSTDVVAEVRSISRRPRGCACRQPGFDSDDRLLLDPGIGFGKTLRSTIWRCCGSYPSVEGRWDFRCWSGIVAQAYDRRTMTGRSAPVDAKGCQRCGGGSACGALQRCGSRARPRRGSNRGCVERGSTQAARRDSELTEENFR